MLTLSSRVLKLISQPLSETKLVSQPDINLYTAATMNGRKPVLFLEEAGIPYDLTCIDFSKLEQKALAYINHNPNGRTPTIVDCSKVLLNPAGTIPVLLPEDATDRVQWASVRNASEE